MMKIVRLEMNEYSFLALFSKCIFLGANYYDIYYSPKKVRTIIERSIDVPLDNLKCYCNDSVSNFTRCRKLPARTLIECIISFLNYSSSPRFYQQVSIADISYISNTSIS